MRTKRLTRLALLSAVALGLYMLEAQLPNPIPVAGVKLGLSNIVSIYTLFAYGPWAALGVLLIRVLLGSLFAGQLISLAYSLAGGLLSLAVMALLQKSGKFGCLGISMAGGVSHNLGQLLIGSLAVENFSLFYYFPVLFGAGVLTGAVIGSLDAEILKRIGKRGYST